MRKKLTVFGITFMMVTAFAGCSPEAAKEVKATESVTVQAVTAEEGKEKKEEKVVNTTESAIIDDTKKDETKKEAEVSKKDTKAADETADKSSDKAAEKTTDKVTEKTTEKVADQVTAEAADDAAENVPCDPQYKDIGIQGSWHGEIYTRISAEITQSGAGYSVVLTWSGSAVDEAVWTMSVTFDGETGKYSYSDAEVKNRTYAEDGTFTEEVQSTGGTGFFHIVDGRYLYWHDDALISDYDEISLDFQ
jgi:membrane-bound lytic murein transglycosylase